MLTSLHRIFLVMRFRREPQVIVLSVSKSIRMCIGPRAYCLVIRGKKIILPN